MNTSFSHVLIFNGSIESSLPATEVLSRIQRCIYESDARTIWPNAVMDYQRWIGVASNSGFWLRRPGGFEGRRATILCPRVVGTVHEVESGTTIHLRIFHWWRAYLALGLSTLLLVCVLLGAAFGAHLHSPHSLVAIALLGGIVGVLGWRMHAALKDELVFLRELLEGSEVEETSVRTGT